MEAVLRAGFVHGCPQAAHDHLFEQHLAAGCMYALPRQSLVVCKTSLEGASTKDLGTSGQWLVVTPSWTLANAQRKDSRWGIATRRQLLSLTNQAATRTREKGRSR